MRGLVCNRENIKYSNEAPFDCCFRIFNEYDVTTDEGFTRFDIKIKNEQRYNVALASSVHIDPGNKNPDFLKTPKYGNTVNVSLNKQELLKALKELVSDLENI